MKKTILLSLLLMLSINYAQQLSRAFILSEGGFSSGSSRLALYNAADKSFTANIFSPGQLGPIPDGILLYGNYLYVVEQGNYGGSGKIYKLDTNGTVLNSATVGTNPYALAIANGKVYITNGVTGKVSVLKLQDFSSVTEISVGVYPQEILSLNNKIFVANTSLYGGASDSTVSVIDPVQDKVTTTITVRKDPSSLAVTNDGYLLIGCPGDASYGRIYKVDATTNTIVDSYVVPDFGFSKDISVDKKTSDLYFIAYSNDIVKLTPASALAKIVVPSVYPANSYYGYAFDYASRSHFVLDAKSFTVNGSFTIFDSLGQSQQSFTTGIAPRRVILKYGSVASGIREINRPASSYSLGQNYPNPFNPTTRITWQSASRGHVLLRVLDVLGNEMQVLVNSEKPAGRFSVNFDGSKLGSGVYFYQLIAPGFSEIRKMVLLK